MKRKKKKNKFWQDLIDIRYHSSGVSQSVFLSYIVVDQLLSNEEKLIKPK